MSLRNIRKLLRLTGRNLEGAAVAAQRDIDAVSHKKAPVMLADELISVSLITVITSKQKIIFLFSNPYAKYSRKSRYCKNSFAPVISQMN